MVRLRLLWLGPLVAAPLLSQGLDVGSGAPNEGIRQRFINAFFRNGFSNLVTLPPLGYVRTFGATGLIQEFQDAKNESWRHAIIKANTSTAYPAGSDGGLIDTFQVRAPLYSYYSSVGVSTAGYPITDTIACPPISELGACDYQLFDRNYALFVYQQGSASGLNFSVRDPFYTRWQAAGGISVLGPATSAETSVTSVKGTTGVVQKFARGAIYRITSGPYNGRLFAVLEPAYSVFVAGGGEAVLGFPIGDDLALPSGQRRQSFEAGAIDFQPGGGATLRYPVNTISVTPGMSPVSMKLGETITLTATAYAANGSTLGDRSISWSTSNSRVVRLQASGASVVVTAVGGGVATVTAASEGKTSAPITFVVSAPCCQIGEGAPSAAIQQAFEEAVTRNRLSLKLPTPNPARRLGNGYIQEFTSADGARLLIAKPDRLPAAYVLSGAILSRYEELGGVAGPLGYPISDATPGGRQMFENDAALAGAPVRLVSGAILAKWALTGYETGPVGPPVGDAVPFLTFTGTAGVSQAFRNASLYAAQTGPLAGKAFLVQGLILVKYTALGATAGVLGMPAGDEFVLDGKHHQDFEGGEVEYAEGDSEARVNQRERRPAVTAVPSVVTPGNRVRIVVGGFEPGSTLRISMTDQPEFSVRTETGAYTWEVFVPSGAASGSVTVRAVSGAVSAEGSYRIRAVGEQRLELKKVRGDGQMGPPGALLPQPLRLAVRDEAGNPVAGLTVRLTPSPGAQVFPVSTITDSNGEAEFRLRLPVKEGAALVTAEVLRAVLTFGALASQFELANFPKFTQTGAAALGRGPATIAEKGALLAAAASILRYLQNQGSLPAPNGLAEPDSLNRFLSEFCVLDAQGARICDGFLSAPGSGEQIVNLWRLPSFVAGNLEISPEKTDAATLRDLLALGSPVLLAMALNAGETAMGSHFVVATGVGADGSIQIHDPNPAFGRARLDDYLAGFAAGALRLKGTITSAIRFLPRPASLTGFLITGGDVAMELTSPAGVCGKSVEWPNVAAGTQPPASVPGLFRARYCDGAQSVYQLDLPGDGPYQLTVADLGSVGGRFELSGRGASAFKLTRPVAQLVIVPEQVSLTAQSIVNAASFTGALAPGGLIAVFGSGLARAGGKTTIEIGGLSAPILSASPFQINAQIPLELAPGSHVLRLQSPYGSAEQPIRVQANAPAIFVLPGGGAAVVNQDGTLNSPQAPARRGQVVVMYCTGLGAVTRADGLQSSSTTVTAVLDGVELPVAFAGLTPGFLGLYQVNLPIPASHPPRLDASLALKQGGILSNTVNVAIQ